MSTHPTADIVPEFVSVATAARLLDMNEPALRMRVNRGQIPVYRLPGGRSIRLKRSDVLAFLAPEEQK